MCELVVPIKSIGRGATVRHYPVENQRPPVEQFDLNSPSIKIQWRRGIYIRVYAKTNKRVRFEVEFDKDAIKLRPVSRGRVVTHFGQFIPALEVLNIKAADDGHTINLLAKYP